MCFLRIFCLSWLFLSGVTLLWAEPDLDLYISRDLMSRTSTTYISLVEGLNSLNRSLGSTLIDGDRVLEESRQKFEDAGGFYYDRFVNSVRIQAQVGVLPIFRMGMFGEFSVPKVAKNFEASGFVKNGDTFAHGPLLLKVSDSEIRGALDVEGLEAGLIPARPFPKGTLFGLRIGENLIAMAGHKNPEIADTLESIEITWGTTSLELNFVFKNPAAAAMTGGIFAGILHGVQATPVPDSVHGFRQLSDLYIFSQTPLVKNYLQEIIRRSFVKTEGLAVSVHLAAVGEPGFFVMSMIPAVLSYGVAGAQSPEAILSIMNMMNGIEDEDGEEGVERDPTCQAQLVQATQALDFYNMDYGSSYKWEDAKKALFEEGYLSEDMVCDGIPLWQSPRLKSGPDGQLMLVESEQ